jgi:1-deoxy-D-xylulose-5-phosphate reductoisomerase
VIAAATLGKRIALANKELLVMAGKFLVQAARKGGAEILPVDSEHSAVFQAVTGHRREDILRILLTASGGPFRNHTLRRMRRATVSEALGHPTWRMGAKITVDSATLMNKGLEVIEANWLFGFAPASIDVVVHPQSVVHSMVEFVDGSVLAQLGTPDMRTPLAYALGFPERVASGSDSLDFLTVGALTFEAPDRRRFPCLRLAYEALRSGPAACVWLNAANEVAVEAFLGRRLSFLGIAGVIEGVLEQAPLQAPRSIDDVLHEDAAARRRAGALIERAA